MVKASKIVSKDAAELPDDHTVDILSRLPAKSICRFKCVSWSWLDLMSHPDHRSRLPQTLSGFFFHGLFIGDASRPTTAHWKFAGLSSPERGPPLVNPPLSFLPSYKMFKLLDSCNGLLLSRTWSSVSSQSLPLYVVCNPITHRWTALPEASPASRDSPAFLGFDPAVSSHFHVFQLVLGGKHVVRGVEIYSSETGKWVLRESGWGQVVVFRRGKPAYLNGFLHFVTLHGTVAMVDTEGQTWRIIPGAGLGGFIGHSQGRLLYVNDNHDVANPDGALSLSVYVLEQHGSEEWTLKHSVSTSEMLDLAISKSEWASEVVAVHPDSNCIFFFQWSKKALLCYDMDRRKEHVICTIREAYRPILPFVPVYSHTLAL